MKSQFDTIIEGQKKALDYWSEASKKVMHQFNESIGSPSKEDYLGNWFKAQKQLWEEAMKVANLTETFEQSPEKLNEWAKMQTEFAQQWLNFYVDNAERFGVKAPVMNGYTSASAFTDNMPKEWRKLIDQSNDWIKDNILSKLPFPQGFHYQNFNHLYEGMYQYWEPLQRMMQNGITDWKGIEAFFKPGAYQELVAQFMGYKPVTDFSSMLEQANHYFEQAESWLKQYSAEGENWKEQWSAIFSNVENQNNPVFQVVLGLNNTVREGLESLYNVAGQSKEVEMAKLVKDIQFAYIAFLLKTIDMQNKVYQAGQFALPDTIQAFYDQFKSSHELPDYQGFFNQYVNMLEKYMIEVLESKDYSVLQSEVAKAGVTVKSKLDELVELALSDFPFLMQSHADEVAQEVNALRKKVRTLESRLAAMEEQLNANANVQPSPEVATALTPQEQLLQAIGIVSPGQKDDLKNIKGIGPKLEGMLNSIGVYTFEQMSKMTSAQYELVDQLISAFQGRGQRDKWADQARQLIVE
jgi:predicted flap endonuclease-1-like 5' DNA nuclease